MQQWRLARPKPASDFDPLQISTLCLVNKACRWHAQFSSPASADASTRQCLNELCGQCTIYRGDYSLCLTPSIQGHEVQGAAEVPELVEFTFVYTRFTDFTYLANMLLIARPMPSLGWRPTPNLSSGSFFRGVPSSRCRHSSFHRLTSSPTVARIPVGHALAVLRGPNLSCSNRDALRTCEKENRSDGEPMCGFKRPPPSSVNE
jgi:hypothetical protein